MSDVTCAECGRTYKCTPLDDYYNSTTMTDGCCFGCLLKVNGLTEASNQSIREAGHNQTVDWVTPTTDWRGNRDY